MRNAIRFFCTQFLRVGSRISRIFVQEWESGELYSEQLFSTLRWQSTTHVCSCIVNLTKYALYHRTSLTLNLYYFWSIGTRLQFTGHSLTPTRHGVHQVLATFAANFWPCILHNLPKLCLRRRGNLRHIFFNVSHRFSIGLVSEDGPGHGVISILFWLNQFLADFLVCFG